MQWSSKFLNKKVVCFAGKKTICELNLSTGSKETISIYKKIDFKFNDMSMIIQINKLKKITE